MRAMLDHPSLWKSFLFWCGLVGCMSLVGVSLVGQNRVVRERLLQQVAKRQVNNPDSPTLPVAALDRAFQDIWAKNQLRPATQADELTLARRLSLSLAGTVPSLEEIRTLEQVPEGTRTQWWLDRLLTDQRTFDHLAERFARALVGTEDGPFILYRRRKFVSWLSQELEQNQPYDSIARQILADHGLWTDKPAVNFVTVTTQQDNENLPDPVRLAARTSRAFLAKRIDCLQCHDDFLGDVNLGEPDNIRGGQQIDFHQLAAYFSQSRNSLAGIRDESESPAYQYQLLDTEAPVSIAPQVPYHTALVPNNGTLRQQLATWVTHPENRPFARAVVNRTWAILFGQPLVAPIDNIPLTDNPVPLELLADDFIANGYDLQRLIRTIVSSQVFQLESRLLEEITEAHEDNWAVFPLIRLRPEQMAGAVVQATSATTLDATAHIFVRLDVFGQEREFVQRYGDYGEDEFTPRGETVTQRLLLLNGEMIRERIQGTFRLPIKLSGLASTPERAVEIAYLSCLSRSPTAAETEELVSMFRDKHRNEWADVCQDLYWMLLNSAEFSWNH